jgi:hypothetical protein
VGVLVVEIDDLLIHDKWGSLKFVKTK